MVVEMTGNNTDLANIERSWYFGEISREQTNKILVNLSTGAFLVRESNTRESGNVISVKENRRINRYLINRKDMPDNVTVYQIGSRTFRSLDDLIEFYMQHPIGETTLTKPAQKWVCIALYGYKGTKDELTFEKGDLLRFIQQKDNWILCQSQQSKEVGWVPSTFVKEYDPQTDQYLRPTSAPTSICQMIGRKDLLKDARVIRPRTPNMYRYDDLQLCIDDEVTIRRILPSGLCEVFHKRLGRDGYAPLNFLSFDSNESAAL